MNARAHAVVLIVLAAALGLGIMLFVRSAQHAALMAAPDSTRPTPPLPIPDIARFLHSLKIVTVQIETTVDASSDNLSWRGDVRARVRAPVRLSYGCDLDNLNDLSILPRPFSGGLLLRVPEPSLMAVEVFGEDADADVRVTGLRLRDVAGEYHLGLARTQIHDRARRMALNDEQRQTVRSLTTDRLRSLVQAIRRDSAPVAVEFVPAPSELREAHMP